MAGVLPQDVLDHLGPQGHDCVIGAIGPAARGSVSSPVSRQLPVAVPEVDGAAGRSALIPPQRTVAESGRDQEERLAHGFRSRGVAHRDVGQAEIDGDLAFLRGGRGAGDQGGRGEQGQASDEHVELPSKDCRQSLTLADIFVNNSRR